jgi:hypothetical protein
MSEHDPPICDFFPKKKFQIMATDPPYRPADVQVEVRAFGRRTKARLRTSVTTVPPFPQCIGLVAQVRKHGGKEVAVFAREWAC